MKAKDYIDELNSRIVCNDLEVVKNAVGWLANAFLDETVELIKKRKVQTGSGVNGVFREMNLKWIAVARQKEFLREDAFRDLIAQSLPELVEFF